MLFDLLRLASLGQNMELYASLQIRQPPSSSQETQQQTNPERRASDFASTHRTPENRQTTETQQQSYNQQQRSHHHRSHQQQPQNEFRDQGRPSSQKIPENSYGATQDTQYKPLDLTVKSEKSTIKTSFNIKHDTELPPTKGSCKRRRRSRPAPILLVPVATSHRQRHRMVDRKERLNQVKRSGSKSQTKLNNNNNLKLISSSTSPSSCSHSASSSVSSLEEGCISTSGVKTSEVISSTNGRRSLSLRRQKHKGLKSHLCNQCGRSFSRSDMLTRHSRLHSGLKPYQCSRCKQVFSRSDHLSTHERTHTGEKPYQCQYCPYSACRRDMITRHMRTHTGAPSSKSPKSLDSDVGKCTFDDKTGQQQSSPESNGEAQLLVDYSHLDEDISTSSLDEDEDDELNNIEIDDDADVKMLNSEGIS